MDDWTIDGSHPQLVAEVGSRRIPVMKDSLYSGHAPEYADDPLETQEFYARLIAKAPVMRRILVGIAMKQEADAFTIGAIIDVLNEIGGSLMCYD